MSGNLSSQATTVEAHNVEHQPKAPTNRRRPSSFLRRQPSYLLRQGGNYFIPRGVYIGNILPPRDPRYYWKSYKYYKVKKASANPRHPRSAFPKRAGKLNKYMMPKLESRLSGKISKIAEKEFPGRYMIPKLERRLSQKGLPSNRRFMKLMYIKYNALRTKIPKKAFEPFGAFAVKIVPLEPPIHSLPTEIVDLITDHLGYVDCFNFHRTCKKIWTSRPMLDEPEHQEWLVLNDCHPSGVRITLNECPFTNAYHSALNIERDGAVFAAHDKETRPFHNDGLRNMRQIDCPLYDEVCVGCLQLVPVREFLSMPHLLSSAAFNWTVENTLDMDDNGKATLGGVVGTWQPLCFDCCETMGWRRPADEVNDEIPEPQYRAGMVAPVARMQ